MADERIQVVQGDITSIPVDAIVNSANKSLLSGGGVDGAIHRAAGPELLEATTALGGCPPGEARLTAAFRLPARWVIHAVGPVWRGGGFREAELLASCYRRSLELAAEVGAETVSFPAISTGIYHFPAEKAAAIAVREVRRFLAEAAVPRKVLLVGYDAATCAVLTAALTSEEHP